MYKLDNLSTDTTPFTNLLRTKWDELHDNTDAFRYKINRRQEKLVDGKYLLVLNPDRRAKRRKPEEMNDICQPFDKNKFNFTKVSLDEILFSIKGKDSDIHAVLVNVSPITRYHSLLCPSVNKCLPQVVTPDSLALVVEIMFIAQDRDLRIGYNSMCGYASVNHLHYHLFLEEQSLYVESAEWQHIKGCIYCLKDTYAVQAFCFEIQRHDSAVVLKEINKVIDYLLKKSIAHNILLTKRQRKGGNENAVNVIIWPRKNTGGAKLLAAFNVAMLELCGFFTIYDGEEWNNIQAEVLEKELSKWKIDFSQLCEEIKCL